MELQKIPAAASDAREIELITNIAFIDDALNKAITRQDTATEAERREFTEWRIRTVSKQSKQANLHWFKALDTMTNRITGFGVVVEPGIDEQSSQGEINLPTCFDLQLAGTVEQTMEAVKEELIGKDSSTLYVATLAVHPDFQRQGIAKKILDAITTLAKQKQQDIYLVSSPAGTRLYERAGFKKLKDFDVLRGEYSYTSMLFQI